MGIVTIRTGSFGNRRMNNLTLEFLLLDFVADVAAIASRPCHNILIFSPVGIMAGDACS